MATPRKVAEEFFPAGDEIPETRVINTRQAPEAPPEYDPDEMALQSVLAELGASGADAKVNIYQLDARKNSAFAGTLSPDEFSLERIQSEFGPGEYKAIVYSGGKIATHRIVRIAAPKNAPIVAAPAVDNQKLIETMQAGFNQLGQMFAQSISAIVQNQPKAKSTMETLQEFALMKDVFGGNAAPAQNPMELISLALSLSEKMNPREGEPGAGEVIMKAIEQFGPIVGQILPQQMAQNAAPIPRPAPQIPAPQIPQSPENEEMSMMVKIYLKTLATAAKSGADPETYAYAICDFLPAEQIRQFIGGANVKAQIIEAVPDAAHCYEWFEELLNLLRELTAPEIGASVAQTIIPEAPDNAATASPQAPASNAVGNS